MTASPPPRGTATAPATATPSPRCIAGAATVTHASGDASTQSLCVRSGTTVTVVLKPRAQGSWPQPRSSNPMLALVTSSATDGQGVTRVTVRAARMGAVTVTWGPASAPLFTLRLSVAAYSVQ
ncbi:acetyl-CoA synthetase [Streptomyces sp. CoH27]|uniref:acetyl-CoA synthetase n=1 Tax=Streptomyces sp. CoH27 TaxID=2875763 RepID=UPI001CD7EECE|nr:acetyl-CoA synthetase [Streptomyces sp. CoH27]